MSHRYVWQYLQTYPTIDFRRPSPSFSQAIFSEDCPTYIIAIRFHSLAVSIAGCSDHWTFRPLSVDAHAQLTVCVVFRVVLRWRIMTVVCTTMWRFGTGPLPTRRSSGSTAGKSAATVYSPLTYSPQQSFLPLVLIQWTFTKCGVR